MSGTCTSTLRIRIGLHTLDRLKDLFGPDMIIGRFDENIIIGKFDKNKYEEDLTHLSYALSSYIMGHRAVNDEWETDKSADGIVYHIPSAAKLSGPNAFWSDLQEVLSDTAFNDFHHKISDAVHENSYMSHIMWHKINSADDGMPFHRAVKPREEHTESGSFIAWDIETSWVPPILLIKKISAFLVNEETQFYYNKSVSREYGLMIFKDGKTFEFNHDEFIYPSLDMALGRGITAGEIESFLEGAENWLFRGEKEDSDLYFDEEYGADIQNESTALLYLIKNLMLNDHEKALSELSGPGALRLALAAMAGIDQINISGNPEKIKTEHLAGFLDRLFPIIEENNPGFNRNTFQIFIHEILPDGYTIADIELVIENALESRTVEETYVDFSGFGFTDHV